jgi:hypothetical protein
VRFKTLVTEKLLSEANVSEANVSEANVIGIKHKPNNI